MLDKYHIPQQQSCTAIGEQFLMLLSTCSLMFAREKRRAVQSKANMNHHLP
jgi:hypothetical protein